MQPALTDRFGLSLWRQTLNFFLASRCSTCEAVGDALCWQCFCAWPLRPHAVSRGAATHPLLGLAAADYGEPFDALLKDFKEQGCASLDVFFATVMARQLLAHSPSQALGDLVLVAVPSSTESFATRGFVPAELLAIRLADALARESREIRVRLKVMAGLRRVRSGDDQSRLGQQQRSENLENAMLASKLLVGAKVWLVDDIVTTGSTLLEARRALEAVAAEVIGFSVFAETLLKRYAGNLKWV